MTFYCPTCKWPIPPELILAERQRELASRPRPGSKGNNRRKPKPKPKTPKE